MLSNDAMRIRFAPLAEGCTVRSIRDAENGTGFVAPGASGPLWRIELRSTDGTLTEVNSLDPAETSESKMEGLTLTWRHLAVEQERDALDVRAFVWQNPAVPRLSHWRIEADNRSAKWGIWKVHFPIIPGLATDKGSYFAWPEKVGGLTRTPLARLPIQMRYPTHEATMQFCVVGAPKGCLYLATHDPRAFWKEYNLETDGKGGAQFRFTHFPEGMGEPGRSFRMTYEVWVGVVDGDWIDACKLYRQFALHQKWCGPPIAERASTPEWYKEIAAWFVGFPDEGTVKAAANVDEPMAYQWYEWHQIPFDNHYPDYFPVKPEFHRVRDMLRDADVRAVPYINVRLWDLETASYRDEGAEPWATLGAGGKRTVERWGQNREFAVMCPTTRFWQEKIAGICERIVGEFGCDGVYLDQAGSYLPVACFDPKHGHALGGGDWWVTGYRNLVKLAQQRARAIRPDAILTTEDNAEPYADLFDGLLTWSGTFVAADLVPMYHYVYSGRVITYGRAEGYDDLARDQQNAQMFVWGTQLCWMNSAHFQPEMATGQFLRTLARAYTGAARKFTLYGEMLRPAPVVNGVPGSTAKWTQDIPVTMPEVVHSLWRAPDGTLGLVAANWSNTAHSVLFEVDLKQAGLDANAAAITDLTPAQPPRRVEGSMVQLSVDMPARSAKVFEIAGQ